MRALIAAVVALVAAGMLAYFTPVPNAVTGGVFVFLFLILLVAPGGHRRRYRRH